MKRFVTVALVFMLVVGLTLTAGAQVTIRHWDWHQPRMNLKQKYMAEYEKLNPDVKFETQIIAWDDYWTRLMSGVAGGDVPDIAQFHNWPKPRPSSHTSKHFRPTCLTTSSIKQTSSTSKLPTCLTGPSTSTPSVL